MLQIFHKKTKGFTLIELLVVIAIIGVLASIVLASLNTARRKGRDAKRVADIKQIQTALELYFDSSASYPTALSALVTGNQLPVLPLDPLNTGIYVYTYAYSPAASPLYYHLTATLEETGNTMLLNSDKDCSSTGTTCPAGVIYTGTTSTGVDPIYDLVP